MQVKKILLPINTEFPFDYLANSGERGNLVSVPFRGSSEIGVIWGFGESEVAEYKIKKIDEVLPLPKLPEKLLEFIQKVADYNLAPLGNVLKMALPVQFTKKIISKNMEAGIATLPRSNSDTKLSETQKNISDDLRAKVKAKKFSANLLDGVTGSGKTEVYFEAIEEAITEGKQVLVLLPEISLSVQWLERFKKRFCITPEVWHSDRTPKQRRETWLNIIEGKSQLVVGARSALFLPFQNLGLIVVDEEHDQSYKQEEGVIYHGRDMAVLRAKLEEIPIALVSATPSLETVNNITEGKYELLHLPERFGSAGMPNIELVDMRKQKLAGDEFISPYLREKLSAALAANQQAVLFLNRRGYAPLTLCRACGHRLQCPNCSAWLVEHQNPHKLNCHHCGYSSKPLTTCPECKTDGKLHACGPGVERVFDEVKKYFPDINAEMISSDTPKNIEEIINRMQNHEIDILIGTQIIAKGHHFPKLALCGIIDADLGLNGGDLRALERTYQLLHQVSGRAGRESEIGTVVIQTYMPENIVMQALSSGGRDGFVEMEMDSRRKFKMPPFSRLATITLSGKNEALVKEAISKIAYNAPRNSALRIIGPAPAPMSFLRNQYRYRLILKAEKKFNIQAYIKSMLPQKLPSSLRVKIDIDPFNFI